MFRIFNSLFVIVLNAQKMESKKNIEEALLIRYFSGELSSEESIFVENWIEESEENKKLAEQILHIFFSIDILQSAKNLETDKALKKVRKRILTKTKYSFTNIFKRVAAILILPFFCATLYFFVKDASEPVQLITMKASIGMVASFTLPDSTKVWLNAGSTLKYPAKFNGKTREVELEGEAFFNVTKDDKCKFVVSLKDSLSVEVLGTKFNIEAYGDDNIINTTLVEGNIQFSHYHNGNKILTQVMPAQRLTYNSKENEVSVKNVSVMPDIAWKYNKIIFEKTSLEDALKILKQHYNVEFIIRDEALKNNSFTGKFTEEQLETILIFFSISTDIKYRRINRSNNEDKRDIIELF